MIQVYVGETRSTKLIKRLRELKWGRIWVDRRPRAYDGEPWAFDNGAYADYLNERPFDEERFLRRYDQARELGAPAFGVVPDIVGRGHESLAFSVRWRHRLDNDWRWYLVVQDGMSPECVKAFLGDFDGLFLGGTDNFKGFAALWVKVAHDHGLPLHYGRVSTPAKLAHAVEVGADSCDSSFPLWSMKRFETFALHWRHGHPQFSLFENEAAERGEQEGA